MPVVAAGVAGVGLLVSAYSAHQAGQAQQRAMNLQQSAIQADQAFRQQQYDDYKKQYGPIEQEMTQRASSEQPLNLGPNWARIQSNFDTAGRNATTSLARKGMLGSGQDANSALEMGRAYTLSDAFSKGIQARDQLRLQLMQAGKNMPQQAGFVAQGNQNLSNFFGNQSNLFANAAAGAGQGISSGLGALGYALGNYPGAAPDPTVDARTVAPTENLQPLTPMSGGIDYSALTPAYPSVAGLGSSFLPPSQGALPYGSNTLASSPIATGPADK